MDILAKLVTRDNATYKCPWEKGGRVISRRLTVIFPNIHDIFDDIPLPP
jgi:hypothetical protein